MGRKLTGNDYKRAAFRLGVPASHLAAVAKVESAGDGFRRDGQVKILFEGHIFRRLTNKKYDHLFPELSHKYNAPNRRELYRMDQHSRLLAAVKLDRDAALQSCSYGKFQVMGFNWKVCGYPSLQKFINDVFRSEAGQLEAFIGFIKNKRLVEALREGNWKYFASRYNGPDYASNQYDKKMALAASQYQGMDTFGTPTDQSRKAIV